MAMASTDRVVLGSIAFAIFWVLAVFPAVPFLPVGRTAGSLLGGMLMVLFRVLTPDQAYAAIDLSILGLLFGTMVVGIYLERADMFKYLGILLSWKSKGPKDLLCRICIISAISSALFTNDTSCVVLTEFVLKIARKNNTPAHPFLLALATSANIGSAATPIGNPQNLVIAIQSKISFGDFLLGLLPAMLAGVLVNIVLLLCMYWKLLSVETEKDEENALSDETVEEKGVTSQQLVTVAAPHTASNDEVINIHISPNVNGRVSDALSGNHDTRGASSDATELKSNPVFQEELIPGENFPEGHEEDGSKLDVHHRDLSDAEAPRRGKIHFGRKQKMLLWKVCVYLVTMGMLAALLVGLNMSWTALTAALALVVLDFKDARPSLDKVSYSLLVFFCGMFITVDGFNRTGIPSSFWNMTEPHARIDHVGGIVVLAVVILVLSNVASNVPTVLLLGAKVAASAAAISPSEVKKSWLILAWVSTVAGNLSILGSAANLIVCEQARNSPVLSYNLSFWRHLKFGVPSTIIVTTVGLALIR